MAVSEAEPEIGSLMVDQEFERRWAGRSLHQLEIFVLPFISGHSAVFIIVQAPGNCCSDDDIEVEAGFVALFNVLCVEMRMMITASMV